MTRERALLAGLLRHKAKSNTYKFALVRALNDLAVEYPVPRDADVIAPLRKVAERWLVHYWPFTDPGRPVLQGASPSREGVARQDMSFRPALTEVRRAWEALPYTRSHPADGALLLADYRAGRDRLPPPLRTLTDRALRSMAQAVRQPLRYAGPTTASLQSPGPRQAPSRPSSARHGF